MAQGTAIGGLIWVAWGLWCLIWAPGLAARVARGIAETSGPSVLEATALDRDLAPAGWRALGLFWLTCGLWVVAAALR